MTDDISRLLSPSPVDDAVATEVIMAPYWYHPLDEAAVSRTWDTAGVIISML